MNLEYLSNSTPNYFGFWLGLYAIFVIALWHPLIIKGYYYYGKWPCMATFACSGVITIYLSLVVENLFYSALWAFWGVVSLWSVVEVPLQEKRVQKGYFPKGRT